VSSPTGLSAGTRSGVVDRALRAWPWAGLVARLVLAGVFVTAGALKLPDPAESVRAVRAYRLLPEAVVPTVGYGLPLFEVALGLLLVVGLAVRLAAVASGVLLVLFVVGVGAAWARGLQIDCGCFGGGGEVGPGETEYGREVARDLGLLALAGLLAWRPSTRLSLDSFLSLHDDHHEDPETERHAA
jgi:uncharacterized membrane protein YphA (DoxX/SURF4 family)